MAAEKRLRGEVDELKTTLRRLHDAKRDERRRPADDDALRKIRKLEETTSDLQRTISNQKQVSECAVSNQKQVSECAVANQKQVSECAVANQKQVSECAVSNQKQVSEYAISNQ